MSLNISALRGQFPILSQQINGRPLAYLDTAATAQKPLAVLDAMRAYEERDNANVHRGMHQLAERATVAYEGARAAVQRFIHAARPEEIIFTKSCTEAINLVAISLSRGQTFAKGDAVVLSVLEHHSNVVPWLQLMERKGIEVLWVECDAEGRLNLDQLAGFLKKGNVKLVSVTAQSNVLGVRTPLPEIIRMSHAAGARVLVDAAQLAGHGAIDVRAPVRPDHPGGLDCDFLAFSAHKMYGPTGIGVLYGKADILRAMPPFLGGGMMIEEVRRDRFTPADIPQRFEAGTPPVTEAVGLHAAIDWLGNFSWADIAAHEDGLIARARTALGSIRGLRILGDPRHGCLSFVLEGVHPHDLTQVLGEQGICLRAGHHCTQPLHRFLGVPASSRLSVALYNTEEEIDRLAPAIMEVQKKFQP